MKKISKISVFIIVGMFVLLSISTSAIAPVTGSGTANYIPKWEDSDTLTDSIMYETGSKIGISTTGPDRKLDVLDSSGDPQLRLTYTDGSVFTDLETTISGYFLIAPSGGRVGIGTATPDNLLDIEEAGTAKSNLDIFHITNRINAQDMDGTETSIRFNQYYWTGMGDEIEADAGRITVGTETDWGSAAGTQDGYMAFHTVLGGTVSEAVRINSAGNVGIGTAVPDAKVHLREDTGDNAIAFSDDSDTPEFVMGVDATDSKFKIHSSTALTTDSDFVIAQDGWVGIGTGTPDASLDVAGSAFFNTIGLNNDFRVSSQGASYTLFVDASEDKVGIGTSTPDALLNLESGSANHQTFLKIEQTEDTNNDKFIHLKNTDTMDTNSYWIYTEGDDAEDSFVVKGDGRVGIGISSPSCKLQVVGGHSYFNTGQQSWDFVVMGDTDGSLLFVDGSADGVGIGTSAPDTVLEVDGVVTLNEETSNPTSPTLEDRLRMYMKANKLVIQYYNFITTTTYYYYLDLDQATSPATWTYTTTAP